MFGLTKKEKLVKYLIANGFKPTKNPELYKSDKVTIRSLWDCYRVFSKSHNTEYSEFNYSNNIEASLVKFEEKVVSNFSNYLIDTGCALLVDNGYERKYRLPFDYILNDTEFYGNATIRLVNDVYGIYDGNNLIETFSVYDDFKNSLRGLTLSEKYIENYLTSKGFKKKYNNYSLGNIEVTVFSMRSFKVDNHTGDMYETIPEAIYNLKDRLPYGEGATLRTINEVGTSTCDPVQFYREQDFIDNPRLYEILKESRTNFTVVDWSV